MHRTDPLRDLELLVRSRHGLILVDTPEDERVATLLRHSADALGLALFLWSRTRGLRRDGAEAAVYGTADPAQLLAHISAAGVPAFYLLHGFASLLSNEAHAEQLRDAAAAASRAGGAVVLVADSPAVPEALGRHLSTVRLPDPDAEEYRALLDLIIRDLSRHRPVRAELAPRDRDRLLHALGGLTLLEAEKALTRAIVEDGKLAADDIAHVIAAKKQIVERDGLLEYYPAEEALDQVAGLAGLKAWLAQRSSIVADPRRAAEFGLTFPKGILLIGVPGCGKSLCARAVAAEWGLPLLKLDPGALYNKYIGESERNFRRACAVAERVAPVVLFIDEIEKAFAAGGSEDGGVSQRVLGSFLAWLQDRRGAVFTVATANDVSRLPPELLRKGRFDEVFFVDLPDAAARAEIVRVHLHRRNRPTGAFDLPAITAATDGFSGAEIEQAIVSALYSAFAAGGQLTTERIVAEARATRPISITMSERIAHLRGWAADRTVPAN
jgi:SpoVK/Ycf46/Vps4 family AAA+-type ATPase